MRPGLFLLPVLVATALARPARAQPEAGIQRVAVVRIDYQGDIPEANRDLFSERLVQGLSVAQFEVLAGTALERRLRDGRRAACADPSCYVELAGALGVGYLVAGHVSEQSKTYALSLDLVNGRTGVVVASARERCETCGIEEASEKMNLAASALRARLEALARAPARFVIRSRPAAAVALIDGKSVGRTPLDLEIPAGEHQLTLELPGYEPLRRTLTVVSGVDETFEYELVQQPTTFPYRTFGWAAIAVGVASLATGIWALAVDGKEIACDADEQDPNGRCPWVRNTDVLGAVLVGVGAVSTSLGGVSLFLSVRAVEAPAEGRAQIGLGLRGRF